MPQEVDQAGLVGIAVNTVLSIALLTGLPWPRMRLRRVVGPAPLSRSAAHGSRRAHDGASAGNAMTAPVSAD